MKFYTVSNDILTHQATVLESSGLDITSHINIFKVLGKEKNFKDLESISPYDIIILEDCQFSQPEGTAFIGKIKKIPFALIAPNSTFTIHDKNKNDYFCQIFYSKLHICSSLEELNTICVAPDISHYNDTERKAYAWLESGKTGLSSITICNYLLPDLSHHSFDKDDIDKGYYPHDSADFKRCLGFFNAVPELESSIPLLSNINPTWQKLVQQWDNIKELVLNGQNDEAYNMIKKCVNNTKNKI